jgi:small subunit ribosomal protein S9
METKKEIWAVGRRKTSIARVKLAEGTGKITVNKKDIKDYITAGEGKLKHALQPLQFFQIDEKFDLTINVKGGGITGQAGAILHGIARAIAKKSPDLISDLRKEGFLTRDSRMVERKKYGLHKARRGTQFSKR